MDEMMCFGIIKTIVISDDYFNQLTENERYKLESLLECSTRVKWMITTERSNYFKFLYTQHPYIEPKYDS